MNNDERTPAALAVDPRELFERAVESATDFAIFTIDPAGNITSWNIGAERLFGYTETEILGRPDEIMFVPEDRAAGKPAEEKCRAGADGSAADERWHLRKNGSRFWASGRVMPLRDPEDGFVKIARDQTERHQAHQALQEREERFRTLATNIPQLVFGSRADGYRTWASPQWIDFAGLTAEQSLGLGWLNAILPEDRQITLDAWREAAGTGEYYCEHRIRRAAGGEYRWHQTRARPVDRANAVTSEWVGTMTDIHDLRGLKDRQQVLLAELQHRTRNLLAVVQAIASQTRRGSTSLADFGGEFDSRLRALSRVQGLLSDLEQRDIDLRELVEAELRAHGDGAIETGKVTVEGPAVLLPPNSAQALGLTVHELATNAVKHGALKYESGLLHVRWETQNEADQPTVCLEWTERGVHIPESSSPRRKGYGTELIERALPYQLRARTSLQFGSDGVRCVIIVPLRNRSGSHG